MKDQVGTGWCAAVCSALALVAVLGCSDTSGDARMRTLSPASGVGGYTGAATTSGSGGAMLTQGSGVGGSVALPSGGMMNTTSSAGGSLQAAGGSSSGGSPASGVGGTGGNTSASTSGGTMGSTNCKMGPGKALKFDGNAEDLLTADLGADLPVGRASRTVELWAQFDDSSWVQEHSIFEYGMDGACNVFGLDTDEPGSLNPYGQGCGSDNTVQIMPALSTTGWAHLAFAYDMANNKFQFTVNGVEQTLPSPSPDAGWSTGTSPLTLGAPTDGTFGFSGTLDEVRVWNVVRTPVEIARDMRVLLHGNEPGLVAYYHFDEGQGTHTADASPGSHHADMVSTQKPMWVDSTIPGNFSCAP